MKLRFSSNSQISARTALLSLALCISLSACKTQSTTSQSSSGMPASKPPSSSPSASSPSSSPSSMPSGGNTRPSSRAPGSTTSADSGQQSSSGSNNGQDREQGSSSGLPSSPGPQSSGPQSSGSGQFEDGSLETSDSGAGAADSPLYEQYDPAGDGDADVSDASTSPGARAETADISFDESTAAAGGNNQSTAERQASLEAELEGSFGRYDGMILRERDKVLADGAARGAEDQLEQEDPGFGQGGEGDGAGEGGNSPYGAPNTESGADSSNSGDGQSPAARGENNGDYQGAKGKPANNGLPPVPDDIPDGSDDDIVARQIREAAMAEKDPKLREKLWEEYRKYKQR
ncbi:hypothetical protein [uncultured Pseudoteredinibacter sp.]|uniref:hypothetical protein n=1 Tax=uncultured Pseudoteredinibacter sp. TaxID=1641701 RepID=UPI00262E0A64|nr:hypothetical protein [uncultured Pseudoteredinibacter sp.]